MAAGASPVLLPILYALVSCLALSLLAKLLRRPAAAWTSATAPFRRTASSEREEEEEEEQCAVCLCPVRERTKEACQRLECCSHLFHRDCLRRWVDRHRSTCPLCRAYLLLPPRVSVGETIVVAPFSFSDIAEDTGRWWLR